MVCARGLSFEDEKFVSEKIPHHRECRSEHFTEIDPRQLIEPEGWGDECRDAIDNRRVDADGNNAHCRKLKEFVSTSLVLAVLKYPSTIPEKAVDHRR